MRLLIHDTLATSVFVEPIRRGWVPAGIDITPRETLGAEEVAADDFALVASPECTLLVETHHIVTEIAVVARESAAIAMRTPIRPDEIAAAKVCVYESSGTAEVLARALMWPFFGISTTGWASEPSLDATVTIVEGALALQDPELGHSTGLGRAWFVMTGMPVVSHVFVAPANCQPEVLARGVELMRLCQEVAQERRRELRKLLEEEHGIERERLVAYLAQQRYQLEEADREALVALIVKGAGGSRYLPLTRLPFWTNQIEGGR